MKKITKISSLILIGCAMLVSVSSFAGSSKDAGKTKTAEAKTGNNGNFCTTTGIVLRQTNVTCYGGTNGNVVIFALGGTQPYTYSWSPAVSSSLPLDTIDIAGNMAAGTYTCTVTDANGCSNPTTVTITQPTKIAVANTTVTNDKCYGGNNGSAVITASGGTPFKNNPNYTYAWAPNVSSSTAASNLTAGSYIITVTDSAKCTTKDTVKITQPVQIKTTSAVVPSSCKTNNGSVGVAPSLGVAPYTYTWAPGGNTTDSITGLAAGTYSCTVTDANGCNVTVTEIVTDSTTLANTLSNSANEKCYGETIGLAAFTVTGGSGTVTYAWTPTGGTGASASSLAAGTYTFTSTDALGCKAIDIVTITQPAALRDSMANIRQVLCFGGATGRLSDGVAGGTGPYAYTWSNGSTASNITNIPAGSYSVMTTDANGCKDSAKITITQPATAVADSNKGLTIACYGGTTTATVYAYGGTPFKNNPNYTYAWSTANSNTTSSVSGLTAGTYVVQIRDSNKCRVRDTLVITQAASFIQATDTTISWTACSDQAWVVLTGGTAGYTFNWSPAGGTHDTATGLCAGKYAVTITNTSSGCVQTDSVYVGTVIGIEQYTNDQNIKVYPNPANTNLNIKIDGAGFIPQNVRVYDIAGREVISQNISSNQGLITLDVTKLSEGTYLLKLTGSNGNKIVKFSVSGR
jgi:hypothetical protein